MYMYIHIYTCLCIHKHMCAFRSALSICPTCTLPSAPAGTASTPSAALFPPDTSVKIMSPTAPCARQQSAHLCVRVSERICNPPSRVRVHLINMCTYMHVYGIVHVLMHACLWRRVLRISCTCLGMFGHMH